ncbi:helix-turn-helix transcriptional regulator [Clostridium sp. D53t1_180928_C8]|uniref:helix-turn-helix transcriptional regulator n=1 Tax=Clostridium sp. D53t1_180928_C8 TaxID=2787101 RepID=UPI0018A94A91|nr:helix-turn-helix transcriptional regulator [Clostridium sp. D53t1_180928_C8]
MNIAMTILKIRKDKKMTQEDFSKLFNVTRQTVSNWENEKSYPDLKTLIKISDMFEISLDTLMKVDKTMVKNFDKELLQSKLIKNILKVSFIVLTVLVVTYGIYTAIWYNNKKVCEENFYSTIRELGYEYDEKSKFNVLNYEGIKFVIGNQEMPKHRFHFYAGSIDSEIPGEDVGMRVIGNEYDASLYLSNSYCVDSKGNIVRGNLSKRDKVTYEELKDKIALMAEKSYELYDKIYGQYE